MESSGLTDLDRLLYSESVSHAAKGLFMLLWRRLGGRPGEISISPREMATCLTAAAGVEVSVDKIKSRLASLTKTSPPLIERIGQDRYAVYSPYPDRVERRAKPTPLFDGMDEDSSAGEIGGEIGGEIAGEIGGENHRDFHPTNSSIISTDAHTGGFLSKERKKETILNFKVRNEVNACVAWQTIDWSDPSNVQLWWQVADALRFGRPDTPYLRADVIYRFAAGIKLGVAGFTLDVVRRISAEADNAVELWNNPFTHKDGKAHRWETICSRGRLLWESVSEGHLWPPTRRGVEVPIRPEPARTDDSGPKQTSSSELPTDTLIQRCRGLTPEEVGSDFSVLDRDAQYRCVVRIFRAKGLTPIEASVHSLGVSDALRELVRRTDRSLT